MTLGEVPADLSSHLVKLSFSEQCCPWLWCSLGAAVVASGALAGLGVLVQGIPGAFLHLIPTLCVQPTLIGEFCATFL